MIPELPDGLSVTRDGGVATVTLNRGPDYGGGRNPLSALVMEGLRDVARALKSDIETQCVILCGEPVFSVGADLKDKQMHTHHLSPLEQRQKLLLGPDMCAAWEALEQVTICAMEGYCLGGGLALAIACDWRVASNDCDIRLPEVPLGINMSWQANPRLTALVGPARAKHLAILGEAVPPETALAWGLIDEVSASGESLAAAQALAAKVVALPPIPVRMTKQAINAHAHALNYVGSFMDREQYALLTGSEENKAAVRATLTKPKAKSKSKN